MQPIIRSQVAQVVRQLAAKHVQEMLDIQVAIARNKRIKAETRLKATALIIDRAAGRPTQEIADEGMTPDVMVERVRAAAEAARDVMGGRALAPPTERPMGKVIELRPDKTGTTFTPRIPRRRLKE